MVTAWENVLGKGLHRAHLEPRVGCLAQHAVGSPWRLLTGDPLRDRALVSWSGREGMPVRLGRVSFENHRPRSLATEHGVAWSCLGRRGVPLPKGIPWSPLVLGWWCGPLQGQHLVPGQICISEVHSLARCGVRQGCGSDQ